MKIFSAKQIREWDAFTIANKPISAINLVEKAAEKCTAWLLQHFNKAKSFIIFCGSGNNGADGLAIARMLHGVNNIEVFILPAENKSAAFSSNLERLHKENIAYHFITQKNGLLPIDESCIIIDALFGTGLNRPLSGLAADVVQHINKSKATIVSIDMPGGLFADSTSIKQAVISATHTLSFQVVKLAFMLAENKTYTGEVHTLDIGLHQQFYNQATAPYFTIDEKLIAQTYKPRNEFSHKYNYGHALLCAGSRNMAGASILSAKACMRSGAGLVTVHTEDDCINAVHIAFAEALTSSEKDIEKDLLKKNSMGIGPGLEASDYNKTILQKIITHSNVPLVIDATALRLLMQLPEDELRRAKQPAILTPHTGEFEMLFGKTADDFERIHLALHKAHTLNCYIVLKGHYTFIATPGGQGFFNTTGNAGMATAGSGDVLTGILTGLLAQNYTQLDACLLGVYLHGMAGDIAAAALSEEAMIAGDIIDCMGAAFKNIRQSRDNFYPRQG